MLFRMVTVGALLALTVGVAAAQETIDIKGQQIPLTCSSWKKQSDGSWKLVGLITADSDHGSVSDVKLKGGKEAAALDAKCK